MLKRIRDNYREILPLFITFIVFLLSIILCLSINPYNNYISGYIVFICSFILLVVIYFILKKYLKDKEAKSHKFKWLANLSIKLSNKENRIRFYIGILSIILFIIFFVRYYFYKTYTTYTLENGTKITYGYYDYIHLNSLLISEYHSDLMSIPNLDIGFSSILMDLWIALVIFSIVTSFYLDDLSIKAKRYIGAPIALLLTLFYPLCLRGILGDDTNNYRLYLMGIEIALIDFIYLTSFYEKESYKCSKKEIKTLLLILIPVLITSMSSSTPSLILGPRIFELSNPHDPENLTFRIMVYLGFIIPILYFVFLHDQKMNVRRSILIQLSLGTFFGYITISRYTIWQDVGSWPLHLCNTAMYTMPLTLLFKNTGLFYFTFFINVLGAFFAILMPNYSSNMVLFHPHIMQFYINHLPAFFMPVLIVILGIYERPKFKYFLYSQTAFLIYFAVVIFANVYLTARGNNPDFFFINSDFIADKLGTWAQSLFNATIKFSIGEYTYEIHLIYDLIFYFVYVLLAFVMWFIYELLFKIVDEYSIVQFAKEHNISRHEAYLLYKSQGGNLMNKEVYLKITNLAKKYRTSNVYTVNDFSLSLEGGKIYGFLGKNGAGKSTIIKSIVGIHGFDKGFISVCGHDVIENPLEAKREIGYVPDNYALYENLTARQYINYIADLYKVSKKDREVIEEDLITRLELKDKYDKPMKTYSHGMKQKVTIIAALIHNPKIWILDEPMTGLDPNSIYQIKECMKEHARKGNIVFFSSHIIDVVKNLCDDVIIIRHGDLIKEIDLNAHPEERETLERTFLILTSDDEKEKETLLNEESKGQLI